MKKIYTLLFSLVLCISYKAQTPNFVWAKGFLSNSVGTGQSITTDGNNNCYVTGNFQGVTDFDPGPSILSYTSAGANDIFVVKLDANGNLVWAKQLGGGSVDVGYSIKCDAVGNVYITGTFQGSVDFDPNVGVYTMTSFGSYDVFLVKLDPSGNFIWAKQFGGSGGDQGSSIFVDNFNNIYTTGTFNSTCDFDPGIGSYTLTPFGGSQTDVFVSKLDASGNFAWAKQLGAPSLDDFGRSIKVDNLGNVYTIGIFQGNSDFDPGIGIYNLSSNGSFDVFISKLNSSGNFVMAKQLGGIGFDQGYDLELDASNNIYSTGSFSSTVDFDPGVGVFNLTSFGINDVFIQKLDVSGNFVWTKQIGGIGSELGRTISLDANNNIYTSGAFGMTCDFDPGVGTFNLSSFGGTDVFLNKLDPNGNYLWAGQIGGSGNDAGYLIKLDPSNNVIVTGNFESVADFDAGISVSTMTTSTSSNAFVTKYCLGPPVILSTIFGGSINCSINQTYSLTPMTETVSYTWFLPTGWSGSSISNTILATPGISGIFSVTASNACGTSSPQTLSVTVSPQPTITANTSSSVICGPPYQGTANISASGASTYTWNTSATTASISVSPSVTTTYTVTGTSTAGCNNTATITQSVSACTGISQHSTLNSQLTVFPNPFSAVITILSGGEKQTIAIYNTLGELVHTEIIEQEKTEIDLHILPSGLYFIKSNSGIQKLIKE